jgi:hypothetical protein
MRSQSEAIQFALRGEAIRALTESGGSGSRCGRKRSDQNSTLFVRRVTRVTHLPLPTPSPSTPTKYRSSPFQPPFRSTRRLASHGSTTDLENHANLGDRHVPESSKRHSRGHCRAPLSMVAHGLIFMPPHGPITVAPPLNPLHVSPTPGHRTCRV